MLSGGISYYSRYTLVECKKLLGLSLKGERNHICERIIRLMSSGRIHRESALTSTIEEDGFGAQALARLSLKAVAHERGIQYVHTPFTKLDHSEGDHAEWLVRCERALDLGRGHVHRNNSPYSVVDGFEFVANKQMWQRPTVIAVKHALTYCNRSPIVYDRVVRRDLRVSFASRIKVAVHVRRGDVSSTINSHRYTSDAAIARAVEGVIQSLNAAGQSCDVSVYTNAADGELSELAKLGCSISRDIGALETFDALRSADILLTAKSAFSYVAALYSSGVVIYEAYREQPQDNWIVRNKDGSFSRQALLVALESRARSGMRPAIADGAEP